VTEKGILKEKDIEEHMRKYEVHDALKLDAVAF
jgi:hypothetical protein